MSEKSTTAGGLGFASVLQIVFIVLKLCNVIHWSWWWVLSPTWIQILIFILIVLILLIVSGIKEATRKSYTNKKHTRH